MNVTTLSARELYDTVMLPWGGATIATHTGEPVPDGIDAYSVTIKPNGTETITISPDSTYEQFVAAYDQATKSFEWAPFLGIFNDQAKGTIEFDPCAVVSTREQVDNLARIYPVVGGAYHFATGNGYWPANSAHNQITYMN